MGFSLLIPVFARALSLVFTLVMMREMQRLTSITKVKAMHPFKLTTHEFFQAPDAIGLNHRFVNICDQGKGQVKFLHKLSVLGH